MFLVGKLRENGWNISKTAEVDRHAAQQPVQEAGAVRSPRVRWLLADG